MLESSARPGLPASAVADISAFLARNARLYDPAWAAALWQIATWEAVRPARGLAAVRRARVVWLLGRRDAPLDRVSHDAHCVLLIDERFLVDLARRRFEPDAPIPAVYTPVEAAGVHWRWFVDGERADAPRRVLPTVA